MPIIKKDSYYDEDESSEKGGGGPTTMLSKSVLMGKDVSPGDKIILVVKKVHDDEVSVEYASEEKKRPEPDDADDGMEGEPAAVEEPVAEDLYA